MVQLLVSISSLTAKMTSMLDVLHISLILPART